ncbi:MAG TPA: ABC transporter permease [Vicinamibacterales bacterium]|nr:ABC transporter permease [Vicinamibacterales bacterium]
MAISRTLYRVLLRLCPPDLRREFGAEMEALFVADLARARGLGRLAVWARALADVLRHGFGARNDGWRRFRRTSAYVEYETGRWTFETWRYDVRHAIRAMGRQPATSAIIVLTLALAIGANTAVFSAVQAVLLRPLPYPQPERLVRVYEKRPNEGVFTNPVSPADFLDWARLSTTFASVAALSEAAFDLTGAGDPERVPGAMVTASLFEVFGVRVMHGRGFAAEENLAGRNRVAVLSHALWQQRFGSDSSVVGRTIMLQGLPHQVIGVLPPDVAFPAGETRILTPAVLQAGAEPPQRSAHYLQVYGRLKPDATLEQARAEMDRIGRDLEAQYPDTNRGHGSHVEALAPDMVKSVRGMLLILMVAVAFVLLIACINVTNLLLAKAAGRRREMALRAAIGAGRARLLRQMLVEAVVLAFVGGAAGLLVAVWGVQMLAVQMPPALRLDDSVVFSLPVLAFTIAACVGTGLVAGILPAWHFLHGDPGETLKAGGRAPVSLRKRLRFGLIVAEIALTSLVLVGAGLTLRSFQRVLTEPSGIDTAGRLTFNVRLPRARYADGEALTRFYAELERRFAADPAIRRAGATSALPLTPADQRNGIVIDGLERTAEDGPTRAHPRSVTPGYLPAAGMQVMQGRGLVDADRTGPRVTVINETMARRYWPGRSPLGARVRFSAEDDRWYEIVGIVGDVKHWGLDAPANPEMYVAFEQYPQASMSFVLEAAANPLTLIPNVHAAVRAIDPNLPLSDVRTFDVVASRSVQQRRFTMLLLTCFAVLALVLAAAGIYGVMAHVVALRTAEIGVRLTLGAKPSAVMRQVLGEGAMQTAIGLAIGLGASLALMQGLRTILFGIEPTDPFTLVSVGAALMLVALLAVTVPALRAMRVDPVTALRQ